jgi:hypothetical protein
MMDHKIGEARRLARGNVFYSELVPTPDDPKGRRSTCRGDYRRVIAGQEVTVLDVQRGGRLGIRMATRAGVAVNDRVLVRADLQGQPWFGWVYSDDLEVPS